MSNLIRDTFQAGEGIFRMIPTWIPVKFGVPGHRLKIHPDDYLAYGADSGQIMERWFCSFSGCRAKNPKRPDQGLSYVLAKDGSKFLLKDALKELEDEMIGEELWNRYHTYPVFSKFFDLILLCISIFIRKREWQKKLAAKQSQNAITFHHR